MPGQPPQPVERKRARGNPGKRSLPEPVAVLQPSDNMPPVPVTLGQTGRAVWQRLWTAGQGWLSPTTDVDIMTRLCEAHDEREAIRAELAESGYLVSGSQGQPRPNPLIRTLRELESQMTKLEGLCGFNPSDRGRLGYAEVKRQSKLDELLQRRRDAG
ncbi:phage terminase small subunit P27 family [Nocardiopsis gilva YIM 90087]|uniref:Phage terminase small subunit P27 family n=1 Tax=Nocardiopsis gilva YIM 90087 TaxID=1235441 RepID=A0A223S645_9ACTN|nr:phage terminase small subunit P27 family [Nocardiopsis gilva]ASU83572.1 phage terminase small subunit P27 family [Nocardiopsis gilva YIM 90087]